MWSQSPVWGNFLPAEGHAPAFEICLFTHTDIGVGLDDDGPGSLELGRLTLLPGWASNIPLLCLLQYKPGMGQGRRVAEVSGFLGTQCYVSSAEERHGGPFRVQRSWNLKAAGLLSLRASLGPEWEWLWRGHHPQALGCLPGVANRTRWSWDKIQRGFLDIRTF